VNTVKCPLCYVDVPIDKIDLPNRCLHPQCPLKRSKNEVLPIRPLLVNARGDNQRGELRAARPPRRDR